MRKADGMVGIEEGCQDEAGDCSQANNQPGDNVCQPLSHDEVQQAEKEGNKQTDFNGVDGRKEVEFVI